MEKGLRIMYWLVFVLSINTIALVLNNYLMFALLGYPQ